MERNHWTVKVIAEKGGISPIETNFWYNLVPKIGLVKETVLQKSIFTYKPRGAPPKNESGIQSGRRVVTDVQGVAKVLSPLAKCNGNNRTTIQSHVAHPPCSCQNAHKHVSIPLQAASLPNCKCLCEPSEIDNYIMYMSSM